jgi:hypothetical protein
VDVDVGDTAQKSSLVPRIKRHACGGERKAGAGGDQRSRAQEIDDDRPVDPELSTMDMEARDLCRVEVRDRYIDVERLRNRVVVGDAVPAAGVFRGGTS